MMDSSSRRGWPDLSSRTPGAEPGAEEHAAPERWLPDRGQKHLHRFFIPPSWIRGNRVTVTGPQAQQMFRVLRMRAGDKLIVLDNSGWEIETLLVSVDRDSVEGEVVRRRLAASEPRTKISLHQGVLRSSRLELVLQKCTELGVVEFVPVITDRCIMSDLETVENKRRRWESIIQEAAEQCRRSRKPVLQTAVLLQQAFEHVSHRGGLSLILWEGDDGVPIQDALCRVTRGQTGSPRPFGVSLFVGPEGGFSPGEVDMARRYGLVPVTMGPRILRAETAGVVAAALVLYELGDMR